MHKHDNRNGKREQTAYAGGGMVAGKLPGFWQILLGKEPPTVKPEPKERVVIERLPPEQLEQILENFHLSERDSRSRQPEDLRAERSFSEKVAEQTWDGIKNELDRLNPQDALAILTAAMGCGVSEVEVEVVTLLLEMGKKFQTDELWESAAGVVRAALGAGSEHVRQEAVKLIPKMPEKFQVELLTRAALWAQDGDVKLEAVKLIPNLPKKFQAQLMKAALEAWNWDARQEAVKLILKMLEGFQAELVKEALEAEDAGVRLEAVKLILGMPEEFQTDELLRVAAEVMKALGSTRLPEKL